MGRLSRRLLGLSYDMVGFERRGFRGGTPAMREHIEAIGTSFLDGYHAALVDSDPAALVPRLEAGPPAYRGFVFEGAAMSLALLDVLAPGRSDRLTRFLADRGDDHVYMAHVGAGWALARLPLGFGHRALLDRLDPLLRWLAFDGWGFHQGFFHWPQAVEGLRQVPRRVTGYARKAFDQGLGRSLWFVDAAEVERIPRTIAGFSAERHADLWAGIGLAATYAGGVSTAELQALRAAARGFETELAQGAAFAAEARRRAGNPVPGTEHACQVLCGLSVQQAADRTDDALAKLPDDRPDRPAYEAWRQRIQRSFQPAAAPSSPEVQAPASLHVAQAS